MLAYHLHHARLDQPQRSVLAFGYDAGLTLVSFASQRRCWTIAEFLYCRWGFECGAGINLSLQHRSVSGRAIDRLPDFAVRFIAFFACRCLTSGWRFTGDGVSVSAMAAAIGWQLAAHHLPAVPLPLALAINARLLRASMGLAGHRLLSARPGDRPNVSPSCTMPRCR